MAESDCGPLQLNSKMVRFGRWLVDTGHCKFFVLIFHEQRHSKGEADGDFGHMTIAMDTEVQLGADCIGHTVTSLPRVESRLEYRMRAHLGNSNMKCDYDAHENGLYKFVGGLGKKKDNIHLIVIGHEYAALSDSAVEVAGPKGTTITTSLRKEMRKIGPQVPLDKNGNAPPGTAELWEYPPRSACLTYSDVGDISVRNGKIVSNQSDSSTATEDEGLWEWEEGGSEGVPAICPLTGASLEDTFSPETWMHKMAQSCDDLADEEAQNDDDEGRQPDAPLDGEIDVIVLDEQSDEEEAEEAGAQVEGDVGNMVARDGTKHRSFFMWERKPVYKADINVWDKPKVGKRGIGMLPSQADKTGHNGHHMRKSLGPWLRAGGKALEDRLYQDDLATMYGDKPCTVTTADELYNGKTLRVSSDKWITRPPSTVAKAPTKLCA
eukprot:COSAG02_NODE_488_length_21256_cov_9.406579_18_plen_435_part_01